MRGKIGKQPVEHLIIRFDGGCIPNPGRKYGSYYVSHNGMKVIERIRFDLGDETSNEAEFQTLETALADTIYALERAGIPPAHYWVQVYTDSSLVHHRLVVRNPRPRPEAESERAISARRMHLLARRCLNLLCRFGFHQVWWQSRKANVAAFGH